MNAVASRVEKWKQKLLDLSKRNRLLNYRETKRSNIRIVQPEMEVIFESLVNKGEMLEFALTNEEINLYNYDSFEEKISSRNGELIELEKGQILSNRSDHEMLKTLASIRKKTRTAMEEQGVNILYLAFGFLEWSEAEYSSTLKSPLVLVPVELNLESMFDPFTLKMTDDDVIVNPTLLFKLDRDFNITLPELDVEEDINILEYLNSLENIITINTWKICQEIHLSLFSFLKLNMYQDLENNSDKASAHAIIRALAGDKSELRPVPEELCGEYDHDAKVKPIDMFQVVDADASQQDAIIAAKKGLSFVLQGPPGTGKSQTITNIIAECLADGKKVLFVSQKMAALEVVYKRLKEAGLTDFCLELHSHKANKKDVLTELRRTLNLARTQTRDEAIADLEQLQEDINKLNEYERALHTTYEPLEKSIYEIHGRLLRHQNAPDLTFSFKDAEKCTQTDINKLQRLLDQFERTVYKLGDDYQSNPWYGCTISRFSFELQQDITRRYHTLISDLEEIRLLCSRYESDMELDSHTNVSQIRNLKDLLEIASKSTQPPVSWLKLQDIEPVMQKAEAFLQLTEEYKTITTELLSCYSERVLTVEADRVKQFVIKGFDSFISQVQGDNFTSPGQILAQRDWLLNVLDEITALVTACKNYGDELARQLGLELPVSFDDIKSLFDLTTLILKDPKPLPSWFNQRQFSMAQKVYEEVHGHFEHKEELEQHLMLEFDQDIFNWDYTPTLNRFRTSYNSVFKYIKPDYYRDKKIMRTYSKRSSKFSDDEIMAYLEILKDRIETNTWIINNRDIIIDNLGEWFNDDFTDWGQLKEAITVFGEIMAYFSYLGVPDGTKNLLLGTGRSLKDIRDIYIKLEKLRTTNGILKTAGDLIILELSVEKTPLSELHNKVSSLKSTLSGVLNEFDKVAACILNEGRVSVEKIFIDLGKISRSQEISNSIGAQQFELEQLFGERFAGLETDWREVLRSLGWTASFKTVIRECKPSDRFIELVCSDRRAIQNAYEGYNEINIVLSKIEDELIYVESLFKQSGCNFEQWQLDDLTYWLQECVDSFSAMEEWIDFRRSREQCIENGLGDFINKVIEEKIPSNRITDTFFKRFYRLWLDAMYQRLPAVNDFRRRNHEAVINDFKELDQKQFFIARARIKEVLSSRLPMVGSISTGRGEIDILRHELEKRRKIMPLRKLFKSIPNLLLTLKPCLLMSPLSVSLFLDPDCYEFDVLIFDEASQICPEDAIGAIFRAKQIIIAGDSEQLPPTNFFNASTGESEYVEDEDDDTEAFESILDEAKSVLPEKSLRWHYRSKHEQLIAYSNAKIYARNHCSLITFPSCVEDIADNGVEYEYVPDGIYDRSGTRTNKIEAQKVAELVFDHFRKYPKRSLGVVTFSGAQQNEIDAAVRHMRAKYPRFEMFFNELKEEAFFIKNLESVQGDERDTIIFSIGYAKDQNGIMHMNFGPLSKNGGYRRLNVAITRAKYNVKVVGSIRPTDIDLERTSADGVKMLRSYINYAINGPDSLLDEIIEPEFVYTESPFEEEVYAFLRDKGYNVVTQVGCSGYRIDMAIKHPTISGKYVIGIECDGASYHSARTARERDRLRADVLRNRGWVLYRIWSTDWIKDPVTESQRLINAIEKAMSSHDEERCYQNAESDINIVDESQVYDTISLELDDENAYLGGNGLGDNFIEYEIADVYCIERQIGETETTYLARIIKHVVELEGPIHFELLCRRLVPLFGREKVTAPVRRAIERVINNLRATISIKDDFCWRNEKKEILVRIPSEYEKRKIEHICIEELAEAMYVIVSVRFGIYHDDLLVETARIFGFNRMGDKIREAMEIAVDYLIDSGRVVENDGKISVKE